MSEKIPKIENVETPMTKEQYVQLAKELTENLEGFPFNGLEDASYAKLKADEEEYPGFTTPIDELIGKFEAQGIKVVFGDNPNSGNVFILPLGSDDITQDSVMPRHLKVTEDMDAKLKELILTHQNMVKKK